ncbi:MAG: GtrA family protein [Nocardioidaceae bacterium]|nr:GtrA family protein [Nocardioidaceae bacterium]
MSREASVTGRRVLGREVAVFGVVGLTGYIVDVGLFNVLRFAGEPGLLSDKPITAKVLSVLAATVITYLGNRHWTWRHRSRRPARHEAVLFFAFNGIGLLISAGCLAISHYVLGLDSALADNVSANGVGLVLGTAFRFWAYRTHVFKPSAVAP